MNILLISQNQEKVPYPVLPIGLAFVAEALEAAGHRVTVVDLCFERDVPKAVAAGILKSAPAYRVHNG